MNRWSTISLVGFLGLAGSVLAGDIVKPSQPHGVVAITPGMPGQDLYEVRIRAINGKEINPNYEQAVWLRPGVHEIRVTQPAVNVGQGARLGRQSSPPRRADASDNMTIELNVEQGKTYYLAVDGSLPQLRDWEVVVSHIVESD